MNIDYNIAFELLPLAKSSFLFNDPAHTVALEINLDDVMACYLSPINHLTYKKNSQALASPLINSFEKFMKKWLGICFIFGILL